MRIPTCLLAFGFVLAQGQEAWVKVPPRSGWMLEPSLPTFLQADQDGHMAFRDRSDYYHTEMYEWNAGEYRILAHPEPEALARYPFYGPDGALWITITHSIAPGVNAWALYRRKQGAWASFDSTNTCIPGDLPAMVGVDAQGNAVIDGRPRGGYGKSSTGVYRLSEKGCTEIRIGIKGTRYGIGAYHRDARGREYFGIRGVDDNEACRGLIRLDSDGSTFTDSVAAGICADRFASRGDTVLFGGPGGLGSLIGNTLTPIASITRDPLYGILSLLVDSRGNTWLGLPSPRGLIRISGKDTSRVDTGTSFAGMSILGLAEDGAGNLWVRTYDGYWIGLRDAGQNPIALRNRAQVRTLLAPSAANGFDLTGRLIRFAPRFMPVIPYR